MRDGDRRLKSGMTFVEAILRAADWWDRIGKHGAVSRIAEDTISSLDPTSHKFLPSGILAGVPWDLLNEREQIAVTLHWHAWRYGAEMEEINPHEEHRLGVDRKPTLN